MDEAARRTLSSNVCRRPASKCSTTSASIRTRRDFTPIFNKIEGEHPDVIATGISHVGVQPTVQWHDQRVPIPMAGQSSQATTSTFWKDTNGAAEGVITASAAAPGVALTPNTDAFTNAYESASAPRPRTTATRRTTRSTSSPMRSSAPAAPTRQGRRRDGEDALRRYHRHDRVLRQERPLHARREVRPRSGHAASCCNGRTASRCAIWPRDKANGKINFPALSSAAAANYER